MSVLVATVLLFLLQVVLSVPTSTPNGGAGTADWWNAIGRQEVERAEQRLKRIEHRAKNVILFLGDGMGVSTVTAARILKGQEESLLYFEHFPNTALSKTYCADHQVTDSAASSTAFQCGVKTNKGLLGLDPRVPRMDCQASLQQDMAVTSILDWSLAAGKSVGVLTNTRITHATPGGAYANVAERHWESDSKMPEEVRQAGCRDIARQLIEDYPDVQVIMGGGRAAFFPNNGTDPNTKTRNSEGRLDNRDLIEEWKKNQRDKGRKAQYVWNAEQFRQLDLHNTDYLFGLFAQDHMDYDKIRNNTEQPSLAEMTKAAITILSRNPKGFYLLVEGGRMDHSHHENNAYFALTDVLSFSDAIEAAAELTTEQETLTVTTADHSHTMVIAGYQHKGNSIFDVADDRLDSDHKTFTTLLYGTGPGYRFNQTRRLNVTNTQSHDPHYHQESSVPMGSASHGGEDVAIYAKGPMAHLFHSVHEEHYIAHVMAYASCVGHYEGSSKCPPLHAPPPVSCKTGASARLAMKVWAVLVCAVMAILTV